MRSLYLDKGTVFHSLHPIIKLLILFISFTLTMLFISPLYQLGVGVVIIAHLTASKSWANIIKVKYILFMIALGTVLIWALFSQGQTTLIGPIETESVMYGIGMTLRLQLMIIAGLIFLSTTKNEEISVAMLKLGVPYSFTLAVSTAIRLVPTIFGTGEVIIQAQRSRGLDLESGNVFSKVKKQIPLLIPIFLSTIRSNNQLAMALSSKGFGCGEKRTMYLNPRAHTADFVLLFVFLIFLAAAIYLNIQGLGMITGVTR
jgi:energy-coupling factor transport system permease protein